MSRGVIGLPICMTPFVTPGDDHAALLPMCEDDPSLVAISLRGSLAAMIMRGALAVLCLVCAACGGARGNPDHAGFVARCNAQLTDIRTANGRFRAESVLDASGPRAVVQTLVTGDRRDEVGDAIATMYTTMRTIAREGGYVADINAGGGQPALTWNGRVLSCRMVTVVFAP